MYTPDRNLDEPTPMPAYPREAELKAQDAKYLWLCSIKRREHFVKLKDTFCAGVFYKAGEYDVKLAQMLKVENRCYKYFLKKQKEFDDEFSEFQKDYKLATGGEY